MNSWRYKRFHISYVVAWLSVGLLVGLLLGRYVSPTAQWLFVGLAVVLATTSFKSRRWYACVVIVIAGMIAGCVRGSVFSHELRGFDEHMNQKVVLVGRVTQDPTLTNGSNVWQAEISDIHIDNEPLTGAVFTTVVSDESLKRGDEMTISGKLLPGFGTFQASMYRASLQHVVRPNNPFLAVRDSFAAAVRRVVPEPQASLGLGFVVGQKSALPDDLSEQLKTVGLTHIVVASGYNLTILVRFARRVLSRRSRYLAMVGSLLLVGGFVLVSGFSASMNRAAAVTILALLAWYYGRKFHPVQLILYVAAVSALLNPRYVWGDLGWLLSFAAFTGVLVVAPIATRLLYKKDITPGPAAQLVVETLSAEVMTLPIIIVAFGYVPMFALFANVLVAPIIPAAMFLTFIAGMVGWLVPTWTVLAFPANILIAYVVAIVEWFANLDWSRVIFPLSGWFAVMWYLLMFYAATFVWRLKRVDLRASSVVE